MNWQEYNHKSIHFETMYWDTSLQVTVHYYGRNFYVDYGRFCEEYPGQQYVPTKGEEYYNRICKLYYYLTASIERLHHIPIFFLEENLPFLNSGKGISEKWYYQYHFEYHYILIASVIDYCIHFSVEVFQISIKNPRSKVTEFFKNEEANQTDVPKIINKMGETFEAIKNDRNIILHEGLLQTPELENIRELIFWPDDSSNPKNRPLGQKEKEEAIERIIHTMIDHNNQMWSLIYDLFNTIDTPFLERIEKLNDRS